MARPNSPEAICNLALDELKQSPVTSISTPTTNSEFICQRWYDASRQECLEAHPWKFATKRIILTPDPSMTPSFGYAYAYQLPVDYIRLVSIGDDYLKDLKRDYEDENGYLLLPTGTSASDPLSLYVRYIFDLIDVTKFSPLFVKYLVLKLALNMSNKFSISASLKTTLKDDFKDTETEAKSVNGQNRSPKRIQYSRTLTKRRGLPGGIYANKYTIFDS